MNSKDVDLIMSSFRWQIIEMRLSGSCSVCTFVLTCVLFLFLQKYSLSQVKKKKKDPYRKSHTGYRSALKDIHQLQAVLTQTHSFPQNNQYCYREITSVLICNLF